HRQGAPARQPPEVGNPESGDEGSQGVWYARVVLGVEDSKRESAPYPRYPTFCSRQQVLVALAWPTRNHRWRDVVGFQVDVNHSGTVAECLESLEVQVERLQ